MIELFSADTPNGKKISIMLEEISYEFKVTKIDINKGEQFKKDFKKISPFSKIPVVIDHENKKTIFDRAWIISLIILIILHLVDIQYFDGRISIAGWILLAGTRNILLEDIEVSKN